MKKILMLALVTISFLSSCSEYSDGDKVIALPEYSDLRIGFIEATVVSSSGDNVVIRADNIRGDRGIPGYNVGEMKTVPASILMGLEEGLALGTARAEFFRDPKLSHTINRAARFQIVDFTSLPLKDWIAKADKADLDEWAAAFKAVLSMNDVVELNKNELGKVDVHDLASSKVILLDMFGDIKKKGTASIVDFTSVLVEKEYVKNGSPILTNTPVIVLKSFFKYLTSIRTGIPWDMSQAEVWNEINLVVLGTEEALNIALQKGLNAKGNITEGTYKNVAQAAYQDHLKKEALDLLTKKIIENRDISDDVLNAALSSHFATINETDRRLALQSGKNFLKGYRDTQSANLAKQKATEEAVAAAKALKIKKAEEAKALQIKKAVLAKKVHAELKSAKYWVVDSNESGMHYPYRFVFGDLENNTIQLNTYFYGTHGIRSIKIDGNQVAFKLNSTAFYSGTYELGSKKLELAGYQSKLTATPVYK